MSVIQYLKVVIVPVALGAVAATCVTYAALVAKDYVQKVDDLTAAMATARAFDPAVVKYNEKVIEYNKKVVLDNRGLLEKMQMER